MGKKNTHLILTDSKKLFIMKPKAPNRSLGWSVKQMIKNYKAYLILLILLILSSIFVPYFFSVYTFIKIIEESSLLAIMVLAMTVVYITDEFDISVAQVAGLSGVIACVLMQNGFSTTTAISIALGSGIVVGALNGILVVIIGINSFVATLGSMFLIKAMEKVISGEQPVDKGMTDAFRYIGRGDVFGIIPFEIFILFALFAVLYFIATFTRYGRYLYAIGGGIEAARFSGVRVIFYKFFAFVIAGLIAALAGIILASRSSSAQVDAGSAYLLDAFIALFLGTALFGGKPVFQGALIGAIFLNVIVTVLVLGDFHYNYITVCKGIILSVAAIISTIKSTRD
jgi:ribose/xylose/arabinose/galactoside ABC-type transport system permease subunit